MKTRSSLLGLIALGTVFALPAQAIFYGADLNDAAGGGTVSFLNVQDINGLYGGPLDAFGQPSGPTVTVNSIDFTPIDFTAECSSCPSGVTTTDTVSFEIESQVGQAISTIDINESGNYDLNTSNQNFIDPGPPPVLPSADVTISATVTVDILEVNGVSVSNISVIDSLVFSFSGANSITLADPDVTGGLMTGALSIDLQAVLAANGFSTGDDVTRLQFTMDNTLTATHTDPFGIGFSRIRKRDFDATTVTINGGVPVPEPGTALLLGLGLATLSRRGRHSQ